MAAMCDRASVNDVAMRTVAVIYNNILDIGCFSHTIDHISKAIAKGPYWAQVDKHSIELHRGRQRKVC